MVFLEACLLLRGPSRERGEREREEREGTKIGTAKGKLGKKESATSATLDVFSVADTPTQHTHSYKPRRRVTQGSHYPNWRGDYCCSDSLPSPLCECVTEFAKHPVSCLFAKRTERDMAWRERGDLRGTDLLRPSFSFAKRCTPVTITSSSYGDISVTMPKAASNNNCQLWSFAKTLGSFSEQFSCSSRVVSSSDIIPIEFAERDALIHPPPPRQNPILKFCS